MKTITYYTTCQYGINREFIHPSCARDAELVRLLTGQKTITPAIRQNLSDLAGIQWERVFAP